MPQPSEVRPDAEFGGRELVVGKRYAVTMEDCCVEGQFVGTYQGVRYTANDPKRHPDVLDFPDKAVFDVGEIGPDWGQWTVTEPCP